MENQSLLAVDPWLKQHETPRPISESARFLCAYTLDVGIDTLTEYLYLVVSPHYKELWVADIYHKKEPEGVTDIIPWLNNHAMLKGCADRAELTEYFYPEVEELIRTLVMARVGHAWPRTFLKPGLVCNADFETLITGIEAELDNRDRLNRGKVNALVQKADALGLIPRPSVTKPDFWQANCPGTSHYLLISIEHDNFYCGWCKVQGNVEDLLSLINNRKERKVDGETS